MKTNCGPPGRSDRSGFSEETFAGMGGNVEDAPSGHLSIDSVSRPRPQRWCIAAAAAHAWMMSAHGPLITDQTQWALCSFYRLDHRQSHLACVRWVCRPCAARRLPNAALPLTTTPGE